MEQMVPAPPVQKSTLLLKMPSRQTLLTKSSRGTGMVREAIYRFEEFSEAGVDEKVAKLSRCRCSLGSKFYGRNDS